MYFINPEGSKILCHHLQRPEAYLTPQRIIDFHRCHIPVTVGAVNPQWLKSLSTKPASASCQHQGHISNVSVSLSHVSRVSQRMKCNKEPQTTGRPGGICWCATLIVNFFHELIEARSNNLNNLPLMTEKLAHGYLFARRNVLNGELFTATEWTLSS